MYNGNEWYGTLETSCRTLDSNTESIDPVSALALLLPTYMVNNVHRQDNQTKIGAVS